MEIVEIILDLLALAILPYLFTIPFEALTLLDFMFRHDNLVSDLLDDPEVASEISPFFVI